MGGGQGEEVGVTHRGREGRGQGEEVGSHRGKAGEVLPGHSGS